MDMALCSTGGCNEGVPFTVREIDRYLFSKEVDTCTQCGQPIDYWEVGKHAFRQNFMNSQVFGILGAERKILDLTLEPDTPLTIRFSDHGIPDEALILNIIYTANGHSLTPIESHSNAPARRMPEKQVTLIPYCMKDCEPQPTRLAVWIDWMVPYVDEQAMKCLTTASSAYVSKNYVDMIVPANVAVELPTERLVKKAITDGMSKKEKRCFKEKNSFCKLFNTQVPKIANDNNFPTLPAPIEEQLNSLRQLRNDIAHEGYPKPKRDFSEDNASDYLCAAFFGIRYLMQLLDIAKPPHNQR